MLPTACAAWLAAAARAAFRPGPAGPRADADLTNDPDLRDPQFRGAQFRRRPAAAGRSGRRPGPPDRTRPPAPAPGAARRRVAIVLAAPRLASCSRSRGDVRAGRPLPRSSRSSRPPSTRMTVRSYLCSIKFSFDRTKLRYCHIAGVRHFRRRPSNRCLRSAAETANVSVDHTPPSRRPDDEQYERGRGDARRPRRHDAIGTGAGEQTQGAGRDGSRRAACPRSWPTCPTSPTRTTC